ncbi:hypothetical protein ACEZCY_14165 [Streptacidiphilus sp. N1-12]|uniref:Uncharacterized protein n=2 Tax=Streptacidiphilus alkalitolerans TaxID=3342712 RepID=A0ABV6V9K5_9ACTN
MSIAPLRYVEPQPVAPAAGGLFSVATMLPMEDAHAENGVMWEPLTCAEAQAGGDPCVAERDPLAVDEGVPEVEATPFIIYGGYNCKLVGHTVADVRNRAQQALYLGEQRATERALWTGDQGNRPRLADPTAVILGPGSLLADAVSPEVGLALLEAYLGSGTGGVGMVHLTRDVATLLWRGQMLTTSGTRTTTRLGTLVAAGGGYPGTGPDGSDAPAGTAWAYATSPVVVRRSEVYMNPDTPEQALNKTTNNLEILAERTYVVGWDCLLAAVLITIA